MSQLSSPPERAVLLQGGTVLTLDPRDPETVRADVLVQSGLIREIKNGIAAGPDTDVIDVSGRLVMPGFVDTHRHTWQTGFRGIASEWSLAEYGAGLHRTIKPHLAPEDVYIGNLAGRVEALNSGITTMLDWSHGLLTPEHADAALEGLQAVSGRSVFAYGGGFGLPCDDYIEEDLRRVRSEVSPHDGLVTLALALRGPQYSSPHVFEADVRLARELGLRVTVHGGSAGWGKNRPVAALYDRGLLDASTTVVHCNTLANDEIQMMADVGASASISPDVEIQMGFGWPATSRLLQHGIRPSLSIDDCAAMGGDMFGAMRTTMLVQRGLDYLTSQDGPPPQATLKCRDVVEFATIEGARAIGLETTVGTLTPGKAADLIVLRFDDPSMFPMNHAVGSIVFAAHPGIVDIVMVGGSVCKRDGVLQGVDVPALRGALIASRDALLDRINADLPPELRVALDGSWRPSTAGLSGSDINPVTTSGQV